MIKTPSHKIVLWIGIAAGIWLGIKYALPVALPFLLGASMAVAAEPVVGLLDRRLRWPRWLASGIGVTLVFCLLTGLLIGLIALLAKQAGRLTVVLPELTEAARSGLGSLEGWMLRAAGHAPTDVRPMLTGAVTDLFSGSSTMMDGLIQRILGLATALFSALTDGALGFATAVLAAYMISMRLPWLRQTIRSRLPQNWRSRYVPMIKGLRGAVGGWFMAQFKLAGMALVILLIALWALKIPYAPIWAVGIALVDAFPILGCGTVLVPWSLICFAQGQQARGIGLLGTYALVWLTRSVLEPKLLGKELGLDPLVTLISIYAGLKLFGFLGMILAPVLVMTVLRMIRSFDTRPET